MVNDKPLVSVIMCEHNTPKDLLIESLQSMIFQSYQNFELIFVDDCSLTKYDDINLLCDERVHIIRNKRNLGLAASRNIGIAKARGKYIAIMDTDDISDITRIEKQVKFMESHDDVVVCGTWFRLIGKQTGTVKRVIEDNEYYRCCLLFDNVPTIINPSTMIRRSVMIDNQIWLDENLRTAEDYQLWVSISKYGEVTNLKEVLFSYRIRDNQMSAVNRSYDISDAGWYIRKKQLTELGMTIDKETENFVRMNFLRTEVDAIRYFKFLKQILALNKKTNIFSQEKLKLRVQKQWEQKIYSIKNPFTLIKLLLLLPLRYKIYLIRSEMKRLNRKKMRALSEELE